MGCDRYRCGSRRLNASFFPSSGGINPNSDNCCQQPASQRQDRSTACYAQSVLTLSLTLQPSKDLPPIARLSSAMPTRRTHCKNSSRRTKGNSIGVTRMALPGRDCSMPAWSPDGRKIVYVQESENGGGSGGLGIRANHLLTTTHSPNHVSCGPPLEFMVHHLA